jgi:hypothetical protein
MKIIGAFVLLFCTLTSQSQTNKYVIIQHRDKHKEVAVAQGEYVVVTTFKGEKIKGHLEVLSETLIRVKHKIVPLTSIRKFGRRNQRIFQIASAMVSTGMNISLFGLSDNLRHGWETPSNNYKAGVPILVVGIPLMVLTYKRTSEHWTYVGMVGNW